MKCPKCGHIAADDAFGDPAQCPACGIYVHKFLAAPPAEPQESGGFTARLDNAREAVEVARKQRMEREGLDKLRQSSPGYVVVTDLQLPFWSLVTLLVKFTFAAIPAALIVALIVWGFLSIVSLF